MTPDVRRDDDMNICEYVKFKKIPGGNKSDCEMISGVVFTKNIANKKMASMLSNEGNDRQLNMLEIFQINSPCQLLRKSIENSMENMHTDVIV